MAKTFYTQEQLSEALHHQMEELHQLDRTINVNGTMRRVVRTEMKRVQDAVQQSFRAAVPNDPRQAWKAVKFMVYKKKLGGNVSLFKSKKSSRFSASVVRSGGQSGVRRRRFISQRTEQMEGYWGQDRNFILNWMETGIPAGNRMAGKRGNRKGGSGDRGPLPQREFFSQGARVAEQSVDIISSAYDTLIGKTFDKN